MTDAATAFCHERPATMHRAVFFTLSPALARIPGIGRFLDGQVRFGLPIALKQEIAMVGWGHKRSHHWASAYARRRGLPCFSLEDGFLRSIGLGQEEPPLSVVVDDVGIYYDASAPSRLEIQIAAEHSSTQLDRARQLTALWRDGRLSKFNGARDTAPPAAGEPPYVLLADQTVGDMSVREGWADHTSFQRMLEAALDENPEHQVWLKVHPEVAAGRKRGHFDLARLARLPRVKIVAEDLHPACLIERAAAVYAVTSQLGLEGLIWGKTVRTFGMPFYAGWGLTRDELPGPTRRKAVSVEDLVHAALIDYPRYLDPETGGRCEVERLVEWMSLQRRMRQRFPPTVYAKGLSRWKRPLVRKFFQGSNVRFLHAAQDLPAGACLAVWGTSPGESGDAVRPAASARHEAAETVRIEDGFLRSVGLGVDLVKPLSWAMDRRGIYYDSRRPSDLETLLQHAHFDAALRRRAEALRRRIVEAGLTKYNLGTGGSWQRPAGAGRIILVPGQVESDASLAVGAPGLRRNLDLLRTVRDDNPDAYLIYKPHPDVVAGLRKGGAGEAEAARWCDEVVEEAAVAELLAGVDEVHVLTSLAGFEALLRGRKVVTYGQPFYAGWGLTEDRLPVPRRTTTRSLDELTAGVLILYPVYVSRITQRYTTPEQALEELIAWRKASPAVLPLWRRLLRLGLRLGRR
jgi:capsular polysaccharide export protein